MHRPNAPVAVIVAMVVLTLCCLAVACKGKSSKVTAPVNCNPPASTMLKDGFWKRTWTYTAHGTETPCETSAYIDTVLWTSQDFLTVLNGGDPGCGPHWGCNNGFTFSCIDTSNFSGCREINSIDGSGTYHTDALSGTFVQKDWLSGTCGTAYCSNNVSFGATWLAPPIAPLRASRPSAERAVTTALGLRQVMR